VDTGVIFLHQNAKPRCGIELRPVLPESPGLTATMSRSSTLRTMRYSVERRDLKQTLPRSNRRAKLLLMSPDTTTPLMER
jgi:hypothetical protein